MPANKQKVKSSANSKLVKRKLYVDVRNILEQARGTSVKAVNFSMVIAYWHIGKRIVEEEQSGNKRAEYGEFLLNKLSDILTKDFGKGFTYRNLAAMRQFFLTFPIVHAVRAQSPSGTSSVSIVHAARAQLKAPKKTIRHALRDESSTIENNEGNPFLRSELSWTHYRMLVKVESKDARSYYMNEAADENWSTRTFRKTNKYLVLSAIAFIKKQKGTCSKHQ